MACWIILAFGAFILLGHWSSQNAIRDVADDPEKHGRVRRLGQKPSRSAEARAELGNSMDDMADYLRGRANANLFLDPVFHQKALKVARNAISVGIATLEDFMAKWEKRLPPDLMKAATPGLEKAWKEAWDEHEAAKRPARPVADTMSAADAAPSADTMSSGKADYVPPVVQGGARASSAPDNPTNLFADARFYQKVLKIARNAIDVGMATLDEFMAEWAKRLPPATLKNATPLFEKAWKEAWSEREAGKHTLEAEPAQKATERPPADPASEIVSKLGASVLDRLVRGVIRDLQAMKDSLTSGDDSGLESTWDEVCVQVQDGECVCWELYLATIETCTAARVDELPELEIQAAWLSTPQGEEWSRKEEDERRAFGVCTDDIVQFVVDRVLARADDWSNARIRRWLDRRYGD